MNYLGTIVLHLLPVLNLHWTRPNNARRRTTVIRLEAAVLRCLDHALFCLENILVRLETVLMCLESVLMCLESVLICLESVLMHLEPVMCSKTTLTGESRFHISIPQGIRTRVVHWTHEIWWEGSEIAGSPQGSPPAADSVGYEAGRETCSERETGTGMLCEIKWDYHIEGLVMVRDEARLRRGHNDQSRQVHQCSKTTLTGESRFHRSIPQGIWTQVPCDGKQTGSLMDQWDMVRMKWDCRLSTNVVFFQTCWR